MVGEGNRPALELAYWSVDPGIANGPSHPQAVDFLDHAYPGAGPLPNYTQRAAVCLAEDLIEWSFGVRGTQSSRQERDRWQAYARATGEYVNGAAPDEIVVEYPDGLALDLARRIAASRVADRIQREITSQYGDLMGAAKNFQALPGRTEVLGLNVEIGDMPSDLHGFHRR
jgi:hypothetical protein